MARIVVIGAGLTGLCCAHVLSRRGHGVLVLEGSERLGGQLHTERRDGYLVELGADGFAARSEPVAQLARSLGIERELIGQSQLRSLLYSAGTISELSPAEAARLLGFQLSAQGTDPGLRSFGSGMTRLIEALTAALAARVELRSAREVGSLERTARGYRVLHASGASVEADRVVVATSARAASRLLQRAFGPTASALAEGSTLGSVMVSLAWERSAVKQPLEASGLVIASEDQEHGLRSCTFASSKFPGRAPAGKVLVRASFRPDPGELKLLPDATYAERASATLARVLEIDAAPERSWISRWPGAMPVLDAAQQERIRLLTQAAAGSGIALAGSALHGGGIDGAVRSALSIEERL